MKKIMLWMTVSFICGLLVLPFAVKSQPSARYGYMMPPGSVLTFAGINCPDGFLKADGTSLSRATYSKLFTAIGTLHGTADVNSFNLPDYRGRFLRGVDDGSGRDEDRASRIAMNPGGATGDSVGAIQMDAFKSHAHTLIADRDLAYVFTGNNGGNGFSWRHAGSGSSATYASGGTETRPENANVTYCIKY